MRKAPDAMRKALGVMRKALGALRKAPDAMRKDLDVMWTMAPREGAAAAHHLRVMGEAGPMAHRRTATTIPDADLPAPIAAPTDQADHPGCVVVAKINADLRRVEANQADRTDHPGCVAVIRQIAVPWRVVDRRSEADRMAHRRTATTNPNADLPAPTEAPTDQADHPGCVVVTKINADLRPERGDQADRKDHPGCIAVISHVAVPWRVVDRRSEAAHLGLVRTSDFVADLQVGHRGCAVNDRPAVLGRRTDIRVATAGLPGRATTPIHVVALRRHADTADRTEAIVQVVPRTAALRLTHRVKTVVDRQHAVMGAGVAVAIAARKVSCVAAS